MIILSNATGSQSFTFIPRFQPTGNLQVIVKSESQNKVTHTVTITPSYLNGVITMSNAFNPVLKLNEFYTITVNQIASEVVTNAYRGKIFVTNQTDLNVFTTQHNTFTNYQGNNTEFITI